MKWLILLTLIASCGKHEQPKAVDLNDDDGDQILNYQESGIEKDIAKVSFVRPVKGVLRIYGSQIIDVPVANEVSTTSSKDYIAKIEGRLKPRDHFSEWSQLKIGKKISLNDVKSNFVNIEIDLDPFSDLGGTLYLLTGRTSVKISEIKGTRYKGVIRNETLVDLMEGRAELYLSKKITNNSFFGEDAQESIKEKTYRVHFYDGANDNVLYVSKNVSFEELLQKFNISAKEVSELNLFENTSTDTQWFFREFKNGEWALVFSTPAELRQNYLSQFDYRKITLSRENGNAQTKLQLDNMSGARIYFRARSLEKTVRTFHLFEQTTSHQFEMGDGFLFQCVHSMRQVDNEVSENASLDQELLGLDLNGSKLSPVNQNGFLFKGLDEENNQYLGAVIEEAPSNMQIGLKDLPKANFTTTGEYATRCDRGLQVKVDAAYSTSKEAKLNLVLETFVEKNAE